jgi:prolyl-tRNA editing enzyme YbaK/EbsC (Cys-tRNA(Pro) deacylase)
LPLLTSALTHGQVSDRLTGFKHNGVSPVGLAERALPLVLSRRILALAERTDGCGGGGEAGFLWFGGGEPDLKLGMPVAAFVAAYQPFVCDCVNEGAETG